jgi:hypothetical protein
MILSRDYVILNYPKTGTTYLRELLTYERWSLRVLRKLFQVQYACWPEYKENLEALRRELREIGK